MSYSANIFSGFGPRTQGTAASVHRLAADDTSIGISVVVPAAPDPTTVPMTMLAGSLGINPLPLWDANPAVRAELTQLVQAAGAGQVAVASAQQQVATHPEAKLTDVSVMGSAAGLGVTSMIPARIIAEKVGQHAALWGMAAALVGAVSAGLVVMHVRSSQHHDAVAARERAESQFSTARAAAISFAQQHAPADVSA